MCLNLRIPPSRLSFGNTVKREAAIARAASDGIGLFAFDSAAELEKLARKAKRLSKGNSARRVRNC
jgi:ornithine decarboxylase